MRELDHEESSDKDGNSTVTKEVHLVDLSDHGTKWTIKDKTIVDLLKKHDCAPDQKTKDGITKLRQSKVASLSTKVDATQSNKIFQVSKDSAKGGLKGNRMEVSKCSSQPSPMPKIGRFTCQKSRMSTE